MSASLGDFKLIVSFCVLLGALSACEPVSDFVDKGDRQTPVVTDLTRDSAFELLSDGEFITVNFNQCPYDDESWEGADDPLGTIICGEKYQVSYDAARARWTASGKNELDRLKGEWDAERTSEHKGSSPEANGLIIWGANFEVADSGEVIDKNENIVGQVQK